MDYILVACALVLVLITVFVLGYQGKKRKKKKDMKYYMELPLKYTIDLNPVSQEDFFQKDKTFDTNYFLFTTYCLFREMQEAWAEQNLLKLKNDTGEDLYRVLEKMISSFQTQGQKNMIHDMLLLSSKLCSLSIENGVEKAEVLLTVSCYHYLVAVSSQRLIQGRIDRKLAITYYLELEKTKKETKKLEFCPNCKQKIETEKQMKCSSCNCELIPLEFEWVITNKRILQEIEL